MAGPTRPDTMMMTAIGLMSGTSLDGVDVALIETDGERVAAFGPTGYRPYTERRARPAAPGPRGGRRSDAARCAAGRDRRGRGAVTTAHAEAVAAFTAQNRITREDIDIVGFHGQTVLHRPSAGLTVQIGDGRGAARKAIHVPVMHDFRAADVAAGGQGAPFVPVYPSRAGAIARPRGPDRAWSISAASPTSPISTATTR